MKLHLLLLGWLASVFALLGSSLTAQAKTIGLDFNLEAVAVTVQEEEAVAGDRPASILRSSDSTPSEPTAAVPDNGMLNFSLSGDESSSAEADAFPGFTEGTSLLETPKQKIQTKPQVAKNLRKSSVSVMALRRAIIGQESGGKFDIVNPHSGALGYGQLMPDNVRSWGREALGYAPSKREFLKTPALQLRIIDHKLRQYWQQELQAAAGDEQTAVMRIASRWYSGNANLYTSTRPQYYRARNGRSYRYPSISAYSWSVWHKYQQQRLAAVP